MIVQTVKTNFDSGTKDLVETVKKLIEYPIQPIKATSIRSLFPDDTDSPMKLKPVKRTPGNTKTRKMISNINEKQHSFKRPFIKTLKKDSETIFDQKLRLYREHVKANQILNGLEPNPFGNCRVLKYAIGLGNNSLLVQHALSSRWWWCKIKIKEGNYNFLWTQLKSKRFVTQLKKHTEANVAQQNPALMTPDVNKNSENDLEASRNTESGEETATTPSSSKQTKRRLLPEKLQKKPSADSTQKRKGKQVKILPPLPCDTTYLSNHLEGHVHLSNKKALYYNMKTYYESLGENPFNYLPLTFHIKEGIQSEEFSNFKATYEANEQAQTEAGSNYNIWIVKPGENTNRG